MFTKAPLNCEDSDAVGRHLSEFTVGAMVGFESK
jgi:hypothetical protein